MKKAIRKIFDTMATLVLMAVMAMSMSIAFSVVLPIIAICGAIINGETLCESYADALNQFFEQIKKIY